MKSVKAPGGEMVLKYSITEIPFFRDFSLEQAAQSSLQPLKQPAGWKLAILAVEESDHRRIGILWLKNPVLVNNLLSEEPGCM